MPQYVLISKAHVGFKKLASRLAHTHGDGPIEKAHITALLKAGVGRRAPFDPQHREEVIERNRKTPNALPSGYSVKVGRSASGGKLHQILHGGKVVGHVNHGFGMAHGWVHDGTHAGRSLGTEHSDDPSWMISRVAHYHKDRLQKSVPGSGITDKPRIGAGENLDRVRSVQEKRDGIWLNRHACPSCGKAGYEKVTGGPKVKCKGCGVTKALEGESTIKRFEWPEGEELLTDTE